MVGLWGRISARIRESIRAKIRAKSLQRESIRIRVKCPHTKKIGFFLVNIRLIPLDFVINRNILDYDGLMKHYNYKPLCLRTSGGHFNFARIHGFSQNPSARIQIDSRGG